MLCSFESSPKSQTNICIISLKVKRSPVKRLTLGQYQHGAPLIENTMHLSSGTLHFDPLKGTKHWEPYWGLLQCDPEIAKYYAWHLKKYGVECETFNLWGIHVSVLKGQEKDQGIDQDKWDEQSKLLEGVEVDFYYNQVIRFDNGKHAWVDVYSEELAAVRERFGLPFKPWYHLTIGRLIRPFEVDFTNYGIR
jgi:hypothetical protein